MTGRLSGLRRVMNQHQLDALLITNPSNIRYLSGFAGSNGRVVVTASDAVLVTDRRYEERAGEELAAAKVYAGGDFSIEISPGTGLDAIETCLLDAEAIGLEADHLTWSIAEQLQNRLGASRTESTTGLVEGLRELKSEAEIALIRAAAAIADEALSTVISAGLVGKTERAIKNHLDQTALEIGADGPSFDTIVASGPLAARPHHEAGDRVIGNGDLVIIDFGAEVGGYRSDMTRTFISQADSDQTRLMLEAVEQAQAAGLAAAGPGIAASAIDAACREVLEGFGLAEFFTHGTGHGVGLDIHEAPSVSASSTATLAPGHVITVEPGVYIPDVGGVRWEDTLVITSTGSDALTQSPKQPHL